MADKSWNNQFGTDKSKYEIAGELGIDLKQGYNGNMSSHDAGRIGGEMVRKMIAFAEQNMR
jgi:hypothetical protein